MAPHVNPPLCCSAIPRGHVVRRSLLLSLKQQSCRTCIGDSEFRWVVLSPQVHRTSGRTLRSCSGDPEGMSGPVLSWDELGEHLQPDAVPDRPEAGGAGRREEPQGQQRLPGTCCSPHSQHSHAPCFPRCTKLMRQKWSWCSLLCEDLAST